MRIEHVAIWTNNLEVMRSFYEKYFHAIPGKKYVNSNKNFSSYFLNFEEGARLELMHNPAIISTNHIHFSEHTGIIHFAVSVGSKQKVNELTERLKQDGYQILNGPRTTGDGYYESVVLDPENNIIEITE